MLSNNWPAVRISVRQQHEVFCHNLPSFRKFEIVRVSGWSEAAAANQDRALTKVVSCANWPIPLCNDRVSTPTHPLHHTPWPACVDHVTIDQCIGLHWWPLVSMCWLMFRPCYWPSVSCKYFFRVLTLLFADERQSTLHPPPFIPSAPVSKATELLRCKLFTGSSIHEKQLSRILFGSLKSENENKIFSMFRN